MPFHLDSSRLTFVQKPLARLRFAYSPSFAAWSTVVGAWLLQFAMVGPVVSYGSYQKYYQQEGGWLEHNTSASISIVGSLQLFLELSLGVLGGCLLDGGKLRLILAAGSAIYMISFFGLSFVPKGVYVGILVSQGFGIGIGLGLTYLPISALVSNHFSRRGLLRRRNLAMGIITTGTSVGGFAFSVLTSKLFDTLGFAWTVRTGAFVALGCLCLALALVRDAASSPADVAGRMGGESTRSNVGLLGTDSHKQECMPSSSLSPVPSSPATAELNPVAASTFETLPGAQQSVTPGLSQPPLEALGSRPSIKTLLRDLPYMLTIASGFAVCLGLYYPMFAIESFAQSHPTTISPTLATWLLSILNLTSVCGRLLPNHMADRWGAYEVFIPCTFASGVLVLCMGVCTTNASIVAFAVLYGFFSGGVVALYLPAICSLDSQPTSTGLKFGLACLPEGIASLIGTPIAEALIGESSSGSVVSNWWNGIIFAGASEIVGALFLLAAFSVARGRSPL